jgi:hypothetical protein
MDNPITWAFNGSITPPVGVNELESGFEGFTSTLVGVAGNPGKQIS